jgi:hypothetical protein
MKSGVIARLAPGLLLCAFLLSGFQSTTPRDILGLSVKAHGGDSLTNWKSMTIRGTIDMADGITFRAAYLVFAEPGKLRIERDMTVSQGGRYFYEDFLNGELAWNRRNLIPGRANLEEMKKKLRGCYGIAWYANKAESLVQKEDAVVEWREKPDLQSNDFKVVASRPAYVITATIGKEQTDLYIDKSTYFFLQEAAGRSRQIFWDFKKFGEVTMPTRLLEIATGPRGEQITPYGYDIVKFNVPIDGWLFTEDMPKQSSPIKR